MANFVSACAAAPDVYRLLNDPIHAFSGPSYTMMANSAVAAIHLYHVIAFKLPMADVFHHATFVSVLCGIAIPYKQVGAPLGKRRIPASSTRSMCGIRGCRPSPGPPWFAAGNHSAREVAAVHRATLIHLLVSQVGGAANNFGCFFLSGLPGGIDYVM